MKTELRRFSTGRILEHWMHIMVFSALVVTGLSQRFYALDISHRIILQLGGIDTMRVMHRFCGLAFSLAVISHIFVAAFGLVVKRWQPSMVITKNDFLNAVHNVRYYLGAERHPAQGGRYSYTQKFEYWGILTGALIMIATGAVLWKPLFITRFISGEIIPAAKVLHSNEAFVVFLIIALWHIYNAVFSPEVFPLNMSIFTGSIPRKRMVHEHILELAAIEDATIEELRSNRAENDEESTDDEPSETVTRRGA